MWHDTEVEALASYFSNQAREAVRLAELPDTETNRNFWAGYQAAMSKAALMLRDRQHAFKIIAGERAAAEAGRPFNPLTRC